MLATRVIPALQLYNNSLIKTVKFKDHQYIGDPVNTVRIFNEMEVDELLFLDIKATREKREPSFDILRKIADECFMPLSYGGGIKTLLQAQQIFNIGIEKVVINSSAYHDEELIPGISEVFGSQSIILSIDVKKNILGKYELYSTNGTVRIKKDPIEWAQSMEMQGVGEILVTSMDRDGTWAGYDIKFTKQIAESVKIPVIINGGAGTVDHMIEAKDTCDISAVAAGSMFVYQKKDMGVLINYPSRKELENVI